MAMEKKVEIIGEDGQAGRVDEQTIGQAGRVDEQIDVWMEIGDE